MLPPSSMNLKDAKISIIGLGYVGLPLAVEFGKQRPVLGFDVDVARIGELQSGQDSTLEVSVDDLRGASHGVPACFTLEIGDAPVPPS